MKNWGKLAILAGVIVCLAVLALVFSKRQPVLVIADPQFTALYGKNRLKWQKLKASIFTGRLVKPVPIAEMPGPDVIVVAVEDAAPQPYCVIFPFRLSIAAHRYSAKHPEVPVILMMGRPDVNYQWPDFEEKEASEEETEEQELFFEFSTDTRLDYYRAGLAAAIIGKGKTGKVPVFQEFYGNLIEQEAFLNGFKTKKSAVEPFFPSSINQVDSGEYPLAVLGGAGREIYERNPRTKIILFSWLDPAVTGRQTMLVFDDSPWTQVGEAVKLLKKGGKKAVIPSKVVVVLQKTADNGVLRELSWAARALPKVIAPDSHDLIVPILIAIVIDEREKKLLILEKIRKKSEFGFDKKFYKLYNKATNMQRSKG